METTYKIILDKVQGVKNQIATRQNHTTGKTQTFFDGQGDAWKWFEDTIYKIHEELNFGLPDDYIYKHIGTAIDSIEECLITLADVHLDIDEDHADWGAYGAMPSYDIFYDLRESLMDGTYSNVAPIYNYERYEWMTSDPMRIEGTEQAIEECAVDQGGNVNISNAIEVAFNLEFDLVMFHVRVAIEKELIESMDDSRFSES